MRSNPMAGVPAAFAPCTAYWHSLWAARRGGACLWNWASARAPIPCCGRRRPRMHLLRSPRRRAASALMAGHGGRVTATALSSVTWNVAASRGPPPRAERRVAGRVALRASGRGGDQPGPRRCVRGRVGAGRTGSRPGRRPLSSLPQSDRCTGAHPPAPPPRTTRRRCMRTSECANGCFGGSASSPDALRATERGEPGTPPRALHRGGRTEGEGALQLRHRTSGRHRAPHRPALAAERRLPGTRTRPPRSRKIDPFLDRLRRRWDEGVTNAALLFREIQGAGFAGPYTQVGDLA